MRWRIYFVYYGGDFLHKGQPESAGASPLHGTNIGSFYIDAR